LRVRFWWVNQNQTFRQEIDGGYLWSPKRNANGARNPFYDSMREVAPGDLVLSFQDTLIRAIGIAQSYCFEFPKPVEFGSAGSNWSQIGWRVQVEWRKLIHQVRPKDHIQTLKSYLPERYSPLRETGDGLQGVYLTEITDLFAHALGNLIGPEFQALANDLTVKEDVTKFITQDMPLIEEWESRLQRAIEMDDSRPPTQRQALVQARRGQGKFKERVRQLEHSCRITKVDNQTHLIASHCKPWRDSEDDERLDGENGLLLTPSMDHLFDRGFISFEDNGDLIVSPVADEKSLHRMGVPSTPQNVGGFSQGQRHYLEYHRKSVFLEWRRS
jgi:putative restriction endonuclease